MMDIQKNLRDLRLSKGWTQEQLAEYLHVTAKAVSHYECGKRMIDSEKMDQLSRLFGLDWQPEQKRESNFAVVSISEVAANGFILSAEHYIGKKPVTLRVDIEQRAKKKLQAFADLENLSLDAMAQRVIEFYAENH